MHTKNIFEEGELATGSVIKDFLTTAADDKQYRTKFYNLDMIISVGYRITSHVATSFPPQYEALKDVNKKLITL